MEERESQIERLFLLLQIRTLPQQSYVGFTLMRLPFRHVGIAACIRTVPYSC
jgi:hypothetical protein